MSPVEVTAMDSELPPLAAVEAPVPGRSVGSLRRRLRALVRNRGVLVAGLFLLVVYACALFGGLLEPYDPNRIDLANRNATPSWAHLLGTDDLGRDILSRIIAGASVAVRVSLQSVGVAIVVAIPIGLLSAYVGGATDALLMRVVDAGLSIPALVLALAIAGILGPSVAHASIALSVTMLPSFIRLTRGAALAVKHEVYVEASRSVGVPRRRIMFRRILPNIRSPLIVAASLALGAAILAEAGLSFLGLSAQPPTASWGAMLRRAYDVSLFTHPWQLLIPGAVIALTILAYNTVGDGLRDALGATTYGRERRSWRERLRRRSRPGARRGLTSVVAASHTLDRDSACADELLSVEGLTVEFATDCSVSTVVEDVSFVIRRGEILGLVGESGSGKTVTSLSILRLLPSPPARIVAGAVHFETRDLLRVGFDEMRALRGAEIAMVFQDPMASLNPAFTIGNQLVEAYRLHHHVDRRTAAQHALEALDMVQIPAAGQRLKEYPHQLSGGMRQRVLLAMALIARPQLLVADEPTTALDVTVQAQILDLLGDLRRELGLAILLVTHDFGVVAELCDRVAVMYAGQIVEQADVATLFRHPRHPYTAALLEATPRADVREDELATIPGVVPSLDTESRGCRFRPRCSYAVESCEQDLVPLTAVADPSRAAVPSPVVRCLRSHELVLRGPR